MRLSAGSLIGPYEIAAQIGAGGMGEVYRARDTNLKRLVAIKVLPVSLADDPERLSRFQREAETLAALNHPNIAQIHGLEKSAGHSALVLELVDGPTLADRIAAGRIPLDEALPIAKQITDALEAAHQHGIVHRDLKPANIKLRDDGTVKVLDFGLAKALSADATEASISNSPTLSLAATRAGTILGTAAYMSPEQARGKPVDKRADVWAFGCVLFEMLTGSRAFDGEEITDVIAAVMRAEPDWTRLPADTPASIRRLLRRALEKDRTRRLADMADVRLELEDVNVESRSVAVTTLPGSSPWRARALAAVATAALLAVAAIAARSIAARPEVKPVLRFEIHSAPGERIDWGRPLSPDGKTVAFISVAARSSAIWVRPLDSMTANVLIGTERATRAFWSPDSAFIAFFQDGNLKKVPVGGGPVRQIVTGPFRDGAWSRDGMILVGGQQGRPLMRVSDRGGEAIAETTLDSSRREVSHDYPEFHPDGRHYFYMARTTGPVSDWTTYVGTFGVKERTPLKGIHSSVLYTANGYLLFLQGTTLFAQRFDNSQLNLDGEPFPIAENVLGTRVGTYSVAGNGTMAFISAAPESQLRWLDRTGRNVGNAGPPSLYDNLSVLSNGRFVAFARGEPPAIWLMDLVSQSATRFTADRTRNTWPLWHPSGQSLAWVSTRDGKDAVYLRPVSGGDERLIKQIEEPMTLTDWSRDGEFLAYSAAGDVWAMPINGRESIRVTASQLFQDLNAVFSPDQRWIAYQSDQASGVTRSGEGDIFVQSFPEGRFKAQVTNAGGYVPRWSPDGKELFYVTPDGTITSSSVTARGSILEFGRPTPLFRPGFGLPFNARYAVAEDGRFLVHVPTSQAAISVVVNWMDEFHRLVTR